MRTVFLPDSRGPRGWLRLTAYYLSILLALSFICFEVLDLDGSDFPVPSKTPSIKLADSPELRRTAPAGVQPWVGGPLTAVDESRRLVMPGKSHAPDPVRVLVTLQRSALPRGALDDPLPALSLS
jgi:hypothetical protein